jgi:hypothetical protein
VRERRHNEHNTPGQPVAGQEAWRLSVNRSEPLQVQQKKPHPEPHTPSSFGLSWDEAMEQFCRGTNEDK